MENDTGDRFNYRNIDSLLNSPIRLAVMSLLMGADEAEFTFIRDSVGTTDGNLSRHLAKLEESGLIEVRKAFDGKKPVTYQSATDKGREELKAYVRNLESLIVSIRKDDRGKRE